MRKALVSVLALAAFAASVFFAPSYAGAAKPTKDSTTTTTAASGTLTHDPILFVHGWNSDGSVWTTMIDRFKADGYIDAELNNWSYNTSQSNKTTASEIATKVDQILAATGAAKVDIIAHSMGSLNSRWFIKFVGGEPKVDEWVSLGGPNHGTDTANLCFQTSCHEMRIGSAFLTELNSDDETPGAVRYATWMSPCDTVINPDSSVAVSGAVMNVQTACLSHSDLYKDATVYGQVRDFVL